MSTLIADIGEIVTGRIESPTAAADSIYIEDGEIVEIGATTTTADTVIDANGLTVTPGLIDSHVHPVLGGFTPRQNALDWPESYLHCGVTSMVSAGEPHVPGRPRDVAGSKALAVLTQKSFDNHRPGGAKIHAGTLILNDDMTEADIEEVYQAGVRRLKFLFPLDDWDRGRELVEWGSERDMVSIMHTGTSSVQGSPITFDTVRDVGPDIAAHLTGGPIPIPDEQVYRTIDETDSVLELVVAGNQRLAVDVMERVIDRDELHRVQLGTDTPSGSGVISRGMLLQIAMLAGLTPATAAEVLCLATGNVSTHHKLEQGVVEVGRPADLCLLGAAPGSESDDALGAIGRGELLAVASLLVDGEIEVEDSRNMPFAKNPASIERRP
jgi:enamidase